jgi:hypothetical protein
VRINGIDLKPFTLTEKKILIALGLRYPGRVQMGELIELLHPDPDKEPDNPEHSINVITCRINKKHLGRWRVRGYQGYRLERI